MTIDWPRIKRDLVMVPNTAMASAKTAESQGYPGATGLLIHLVDQARTGGNTEYNELAGFIGWVYGVAGVSAQERIASLQRLDVYELPNALAVAIAAAVILPEPDPE